MDRLAHPITAAEMPAPALIAGVVGAASPDAAVIGASVSCFPRWLQRRCRVLAFGKGERFTLGDGERTLHYLLRGDVSVQREILGEWVLLQRVAPGDWLAEPRPDAVRAMDLATCKRASSLLTVPAEALSECLDRTPGFARAWCRELFAHAARRQRQIERLRLLHASKRIAHFLATESAGGCGEMHLPYPKGIWAAQLGISAESLSRTLTEMIACGQLEKLSQDRYRLMRPN